MRQWAMLALIWITAALVLGIFFWEERKSIQTSETARLQHQAQVIHDNLHLQIESISNVLQTLTQDIALAPVAPAETSQFNSRLRAFSDALIGVRTLLILDKDGTIVSANLKLPLEMGVLSFVQNVDKELRNGGKASTCGIHAGI